MMNDRLSAVIDAITDYKLPPELRGRRNSVRFLSLRESASIAEDILLFGLRKKLKKAEEEAEELVREGFETAEKRLQMAEKGTVAMKNREYRFYVVNGGEEGM